MDGVGTGTDCGAYQLVGGQVAVDAHPGIGFGDVWGARGGVGLDGDGTDAEAPAGGEHAAGDLAAVGDQNLADGQHGRSLYGVPPRR
jgi:hypothetical protein